MACMHLTRTSARSLVTVSTTSDDCRTWRHSWKFLVHLCVELQYLTDFDDWWGYRAPRIHALRNEGGESKMALGLMNILRNEGGDSKMAMGLMNILLTLKSTTT